MRDAAQAAVLDGVSPGEGEGGSHARLRGVVGGALAAHGPVATASTPPACGSWLAGAHGTWCRHVSLRLVAR
jgi:hypothetical protein